MNPTSTPPQSNLQPKATITTVWAQSPTAVAIPMELGSPTSLSPSHYSTMPTEGNVKKDISQSTSVVVGSTIHVLHSSPMEMGFSADKNRATPQNDVNPLLAQPEGNQKPLTTSTPLQPSLEFPSITKDAVTAGLNANLNASNSPNPDIRTDSGTSLPEINREPQTNNNTWADRVKATADKSLKRMATPIISVNGVPRVKIPDAVFNKGAELHKDYHWYFHG